MMYNRYPYDCFNPNYLSTFNQQSWEMQRHHAEQQQNIAELMKATRDLIHAFNKVSPEYQNQATLAFLSIICEQMGQSNGGQQR